MSGRVEGANLELRSRGRTTRPTMAASTRVRLLTDRWMRWLVTAGGLAIIVSVLGILFFIVAQVLPLLREARVETKGLVEPRPAGATAFVGSRAMAGDEYETLAAVLGRDGVARIFRAEDGQEVAQRVVVDPAVDTVLALSAPPGSTVLAASTRGGQVVLQPTSFLVTFDGDKRRVEGQLGEPVRLELDPAGQPLGVFAAQLDDDGGAGAAAQLASGSIAVVERRVSRNAMTGELSEEIFRGEAAVPAEAGTLSAMVLDGDRRNLFAGSETGWLLWWELADGVPGPPHSARASGSMAPVTALDLLIGGRSLVVGGADGGVALWFPVRATATDGSESSTLTRVREFPRRGGAITQLASSARNRSFLVADAAGELGLYFSTSERVLWSGPAPVPAVDGLAYSPKGDGALIAGGGRLAKLQIDNPHPEISWRALFGKVWYEGYDEPRHVWQSTGGTDDFESKLGLVPLVIGTLKGTFYSLLIAIPLGVFGAMFASQFMHPRLLRVVKPAVEVMAALPSVVLGFLAGLWLAPRVESGFPALILAVVFLPLAVLIAGVLWRALPMSWRGRAPVGFEIFPYGVALLLAGWACVKLGPGFANLAFGGSFQDWLLRVTGLPYDQRNAVVVGLAMGFAVIPIIFAISEDAFSNVPKTLISGSLALGADRWQTVTRVVLPTASPGIFSAVMIGFGRAVGETMIVLMATGNTPILDWNAFNGFRTLSANIAVEIPEAPLGGTLYRVLFFAALLLFAMTFVVNTAAELVRQRLRRKYAEL